ncbi:hypothetical protein [Sphingopyxis sp.]|uniref:hypothetical protein n=1 Tax=Sphingopyxis sp. TaxID=1908224 RepID=UPI003BAD535F
MILVRNRGLIEPLLCLNTKEGLIRLGGCGMARGLEFNWSEADLVVHPVQAITAYPTQHGVVIRQQKRTDRDRDDAIMIPHYSIDLLIQRLRYLQNTSVINVEHVANSELSEILAAE